MGKVIHAAEKFIVPHEPRAKHEVSTWVCMDDRFALINGLYRQTAGGPVGVGQDWMIAMDLKAMRRGNERNGTGLTAAPAQILGGIAAKVLRAEKIELMLHEGCAAEAGAIAVSQTILSQPEEVIKRARIFKPDMTDSEAQHVVASHEYSLGHNKIMDPKQAAPLLENGETWAQPEGSKLWQLAPVKRVPLVSGPHLAPSILANQRRNTAFDARAAFEAGTPAYNVSMGDMHEITDPLQDIVPFNTNDYLAASAMRHAATSLLLPAQNGQEHVSIHYVDAMAA